MLALSARPKKIEEFIGQAHIVGEDAPFFKLLKKGNMPHSFFFGPPGSGKTTLAKIIANELDSPFFELNATSLKIEDIRKIVTSYKNSLIKPILFIDEVHRLSKKQQEVMLPFMEKFDAIFIGASTENPFFTLTAAVRSRSMLFEFKPLSYKDLSIIAEKEIQKTGAKLTKEAFDYLIFSSGGDARALLNLLEYSLEIAKDVDLKLLKSIRPTMLNDGASSSETHYNLISAMIKSIRGSDMDAAIYYLARLIKAGEDPVFIARRLLILASEDIGNANPQALNIASNCFYAVSKIGYPESRIILSQTVIYLASSPKSNTAITAIDKAIKSIEEGELLEIPEYLKEFSQKKINTNTLMISAAG